MGTCIGDNCDKDSNNSNVIMTIFVILCILVSLFANNNQIRGVCLSIALILLIVIAVNYDGGIKQYFQSNSDIQKIEDLKNRIMPLCTRGVISPHLLDLPVKSAKESYTWKKNKIFLCLGNFEQEHLVYVYLHELAHAATDPSETDAHGEKWKRNFEYFLDEATHAGIIDLSKKPFPSDAYMKACGEQ